MSPCGRSWSSSAGPSTPAWMRAAREVRSISSDPVEPAEVDRDRTAITGADGGLDATHHRGATAVGDGRDTGAGAPVEEVDDVALVSREGHDVGRMVELAAVRSHDVAEGLAVGVPGPVLEVDGADPGQRGRRRHAWRGQRQILEPGGRADHDVVLAEAARHGGGQRALLLGGDGFVLVAPPPPRTSAGGRVGRRAHRAGA